MAIGKNSLYLTFFSSVIGVALFMAVAIGYFWIESEMRGFDEDSQLLRDSYVAEQKNKVKNVVGQVVQHVKFRRDTAEQSIKDIPEQRYIAETILTNLGYKVTIAESGEAALSLLKNHVFDLVVLE
jgi:hypothetical protein